MRLRVDFQTLAIKIGSNIKSFRKKMGLSQTQASQMISCDKRFYQRIEAGKAGLTLRTLLKISVALKMPLSDLLKVDIPSVDRSEPASSNGANDSSKIVN